MPAATGTDEVVGLGGTLLVRDAVVRLEGGADVEDVYTFALFNHVAVGFGMRF